MILGIKTGPKNFEEGQATVTDAGARMAEIWFDVTKAFEYNDMLEWLTKHNVAIGLHHWGIVDKNLKTNLATQDEAVREETMRQIKQTIDIGASIGCAYVNAHPGAEALETIDFTNWKQTMLEDKTTPEDIARNLFLQAAQELTAYAQSKQVLLTLESITARESAINHDRFDIYDSGNMSLDALEEATKNGAWFANDISHTGTHLLVEHENKSKAWEELINFSTRLAPRTRLIHMNIITPPYNGTDSHDGITDADFSQDTFPDKQGVIAFLQLFKNRGDVYVVNEPKGGVMGNFKALQKLAEGL
ncbi:MAG: TIM barrel protein [Candidatus Andersenbacteria bacterium]